MTTPIHTRRQFLKSAALGAAALATPASMAAPSHKAGAPRPNILLIMADDMGYSDIGCYGGEVQTPAIDALADGGLRFTQFYNTARCCPTRASLLTGLYPHQAGIGHMMNDRGLDGYRGDLNDRCATIAEVLKTAGYATYMAGKWHVTKHVGHWSGDPALTSKHNWPRQRGFDRFYGTIHGAGSFYNPVGLVRGNTPIEADTDEYYYTDAITDNACTFIREHTGEQPFFCYAAYTAPHWPLHARPDDVAKYKGRYDKGWDALRIERQARMIEMGIIDENWALTERDPQAPAWEDAQDKAWQARRMEVYAAQIDSMDQGIGRMVETLRKTGQLENTLILFLADNGGCAEEVKKTWGSLSTLRQTRDGRPVRVGNEDHAVMPGPKDTFQSYGLPWANASNTPFRRYKHWVHEGGIASPLVAHWPRGIKAHGELRQHPGHVIDIMATCVDLAGATYPKARNGVPIVPMEGKSLVPAFEDKPIEREAIYWEHEGNRAIRVAHWKLVAKGAKGPWELYDLAADRTETHDLALTHPDRVEELAAMWQRWATRANVIPWPYG